MFHALNEPRENDQLAATKALLHEFPNPGLSHSDHPADDGQGWRSQYALLQAQVNELQLEKQALEAREQELVGLNQRLQTTNQELEQFAYMVSHDLKEPLRSVEGNLSLLKRAITDEAPPEWEEHLLHAANGVRRLQHLIDDLLEYSRIGRSAERTWINPQDILELVRYNLYKLIQSDKALIEVGPLPAQIEGHRSSLIQLFQNIIANAITFKQPGVPVKVEVSGREREEDWLFCVSDNGVGIANEDRERVFDLFLRLSAQPQRGFGIGLATCKKIAEAHQGHIWVESQVDKGSSFYVTLAKRDLGTGNK